MASTNLRPVVTIKAIPEGAAQQPIDVSNRLLSFEFIDNEKGADKLSITLENFDLSLYDDPTFRKGTILEFLWGYPGHTALPRRAIIQSVKGNGQTITIEAHGLAALLHKIKRVRTWDQTLTSIVTSIAASYGSLLGVPGGALSKNIVIDPALDTVQVPRLSRVQAAETDATFLSRLARRYGLEFYVDAQGVHFKPRNLSQTPATTEFVWYTGDGSFLDFHVENNVSGRPGSVTKKGLDPLSKKVISHTATNGTGKRPGLAPSIEIVDPVTGAESLQSRAAEDHTEHTTERAETIPLHAEAKFRLTQHETIHLGFTVVGDPDVAAKKVYRFSGLGKRLSGLYYVSQATHRITSSGYVVEGKARMDGHGGYGQGNIASKAALNKLTPKNGTTQIEVIDPRTGEAHTEFRRSGEEN